MSLPLWENEAAPIEESRVRLLASRELGKISESFKADLEKLNEALLRGGDFHSLDPLVQATRGHREIVRLLDVAAANLAKPEPELVNDETKENK